MPTDKKLKTLVLNVMTEEQYNSTTKNEDELYLTPDDGGSGGGGGGQLYNHHIKILSGMGDRQCCFTYVSSKNIAANSSENLETLLGNVTKSISCTGVLKNNDGVLTSIVFLRWKGTIYTSQFYLTDKTELPYVSDNVGLSYYTDDVEPI